MAVHFATKHPQETRQWNDGGHLVLLTVPDEASLGFLSWDLKENHGIDATFFEEPDIDDEVTAIAFLTDCKPKEISKLPLALATPDDPRFLREREIRNSLRKEVS